jgi:hypothetical protein
MTRRRLPLLAAVLGVVLLVAGGAGLWVTQQAIGAIPGDQASPVISGSAAGGPSPTGPPSPESTESHIRRDFLEAQRNLSKQLGGDLLATCCVGQATVKLIDITAHNQANHLVIVEEDQNSSILVGIGTDPNLPPDGIVVELQGYKRLTYEFTDSGAIQSQTVLRVDNHYLMRLNVGRYLIADWNLNEQPVSSIPQPAVSPSPSPASSASPSPPATPSIVGPTTPGPRLANGTPRNPASRLWFIAILVFGLLLSAGGGGGAVLASKRGGGVSARPAVGVALEPSSATGQAATEAFVEGDTRVRIRTMGGFEVRHGLDDHAPALRRRQPLLFMWLYLLMLGLDGERGRPTRQSVADEVYPGLDRETQKERMRTQLSKMKHGAVPPAIAALVLDDGKTLGFDLDSCVVDAHQLIGVARECEVDADLRSGQLRQAAVRIARQVDGRFLDFWEELADSITEGRGATEELVQTLRSRLDGALAQVLLALGRNALLDRDAARAVPSLERAMRLRPDLTGVGVTLATAYDLLGRAAEARALRDSLGG